MGIVNRTGVMALLLIFVFSVFPAMGATIRVPADQPTIQDGIDAAVGGDLVLVSAGTYPENIDFTGKAITVQGESGIDVTAIDASQSGSAVTFDSGETATSVIDGFTIRNGSGTTYGFSPVGGGIYCIASTPTIQNCTITGSLLSWGSGGGVYCDLSSPTITDCTISNNDAGLEGGGLGFDNSSPTIQDCTITGNIAIYGGGIQSNASSPTLENCAITGNTAVSYGGGLTYGSTSSPITNCTITGNSASYGAGIHYTSSTSAEVVNCTINGNRAETQGGGIFCEWNSSVEIKSSILWGDTAPDGSEIGLGWTDNPSTLSVSYCDVQGGEAAAYVEASCTLNWLAGNIDSDPLLIDSGAWDDNGTPEDTSDDLWVGGDYHLTDISPCIDAGTDAGVYTDMDLDVRPQGDGTDMGADEFLSDLKIVFIRHRINDNQYLNVYRVPTVVGGETVPLLASDLWIGNIGTNNEITHMATGDMDGDGTDEFIVIRHKLNDNQYLNIYSVPTEVGGDINPLLASDTWIGNVGSDNEITHMVAGDTDGDGTDELIFIRHMINTDQYLHIYDIPTVVLGEITPLVASDQWIGKIGMNNEITHMAVGDTDGDSADELIFIRHRTNDNQYLNIYNAPATVGGDINPLLASDIWIGNIGTSNEITHMASGDMDSDGLDELVFIRDRQNNNQYLNVYNAPTTVGGDINPLVASDLWIGSFGTSNEITHMDVIR